MEVLEWVSIAGDKTKSTEKRREGLIETSVGISQAGRHIIGGMRTTAQGPAGKAQPTTKFPACAILVFVEIAILLSGSAR